MVDKKYKNVSLGGFLGRLNAVFEQNVEDIRELADERGIKLFLEFFLACVVLR